MRPCWPPPGSGTRETPTARPCCRPTAGPLLACGSVSGRVLKQIAVAPWAEGDGACARIVTALLEESARRGVAHPFLYTKPKNARLFRSLGFFPVVETVDMLMMEHRRGGVERYIASLPAYDG